MSRTMPRIGSNKIPHSKLFARSVLALTISSICGFSGLAQAVPLVIKKPGQSNDVNYTGVTGDSSAIQLSKNNGTLGIGKKCHKATSTCTFTNTGTISSGGADAAVEVTEGAFFSLENDGEIVNANSEGTAIVVKSGAGPFNLNHNGILKGGTDTEEGAGIALDMQAASALTLTSSGEILGDIDSVADTDTDSIFFTGGEFNGNTNNIEQVTFSSGTTTVSSWFDMSEDGLGNERFVKVLSGARLKTGDLIIEGASFTLNEGATLELDLDEDSQGTEGEAVVDAEDETVDISQGTVFVLPAASHQSGSQDYYLIQAGTLEKDGYTLEISDLYTVSDSISSGGDLKVRIARTSEEPEDFITGNGGSEDEGKVFDEVLDVTTDIIQQYDEEQEAEDSDSDSDNSNSGSDNSGSNSTGGLTPEEKKERRDDAVILRDIVLRQPDAPSSVNLAGEFQPTVNGADIDLAQDFEKGATSLVAQRLDDVESGINAGSTMASRSFWMQVLYNEGRQKDQTYRGETIRGYRSRLSGLTLGLDTDVGHNWVVGAALSAGRGSVDKNGVKDNTDIDAYLGTLYARWQIDSRTSMDIFANYGVNKNDRTRYFDNINGTLDPAKASYDSHQYGLKAMLRWNWIAGKWLITPVVGMHYGRFNVDAYTEKESPAALTAEKQKYKVAEVGAGVGFSRTFQGSYGQITPEVQVMGWHDFAADAVEVTSRLVLGGDAFVARGADPERTTWNASAGLTWNRDERLELSGGYERNWRSGYHSDSVFARLEYRF
ncbi:autotransporter outer membrane beta-barrel domain-containing protein [Parendozoicomonas haliclonae]|uniref:Outer membrane protein B n=1 Tax=Parendozoicomonas haliclonae TaxID=1960125 RepID=A0A1X7AHL4_9GAMM|nr:autotransporter outer membrane beta-barrel domain-containing protein [Parendozoicomonas haliclonae]SMA41969.1 Outer membrane protein B precursor [Parendozoicomonas haliclonae]